MAVSLFDALPWRIAGAVDRSLRATAVDNSVFIEKGAACQRLIVLLGWGGALQKHLSRVKAFYLSEGFVVASYISPMSCFLQGGLNEQDVVELADTIVRELPLVARKTFHVHLYSNNGTVVWGALMLALKESSPDVFVALMGVVLDSAPRVGPSQPWLVKQAFAMTFPCISIMLKRNQYMHPVWTPTLFFYFVYKMLWLRLKPAARRFGFSYIWEAVLFGMPTTTRQLYIYSTKDHLISSAAVEDFISRQKKRGVPVTAQVFHDTPHVQHFLRKETEYKEAVLRFLDAA